MQGMLSKCIIILFIISITGCGKPEVDYKTYVQWIENENNGLYVQKNVGEYEFSALYKPLDYVVAKELVNGALNKSRVMARKKELGSMQYLNLKIRSTHDNELLKAGIRSENEYYQRLEYFMSYMQSDIYMIDGKDTLDCLLFHYERNFGLAPYNTFVLGFNMPSEITATTPYDKTLVYDDKVLGTGKIMLKIDKNELENMPQILWD